jgi:hypothetical protein
MLLTKNQTILMLIWAWASLLGWQTAFAQSDENLFVGSRPLALGGAFTAVADDANAMFYNVAGLQALNQHEVSFMNANLFGTGIQTTYAAYAFPISLKQTVGVDWQHIGFGDGELGYNRDILKVAFAQRLMSNLSIGSSFKFMLTNMSLDGQSTCRRLRRLHCALLFHARKPGHSDGCSGCPWSYFRSF